MQNDTVPGNSHPNHTAFLTPEKGEQPKWVRKEPVWPTNWSRFIGYRKVSA